MNNMIGSNRKPDGSIIAVMVSWNGKQFLTSSIPSVLKELNGNGELLVIDNASTDGSYEFIRDNFPSIFTFQNYENLGGSGGFNIGISIALQSKNCRYIWLLDNDIEVERGALKPLLQILEENPQAGAAGSQICLYQDPQIIQEMGGFISSWLGNTELNKTGHKRLDPTQPFIQVDYLAACSLLVKAEVFKQIGLFHNFFIFYDDIEWGVRATRKGWSLWASPRSVIRHHFGGLKPFIPWREYYRRRNKGFFLILHPPIKGKWFAIFLHLVVLNYWTQFYKFTGNYLLHQTFRTALDDLLNLQLGKSRFTITTTPFIKENLPENLYSGSYWIDIPESLGDAISAIKIIQNNYPEASFQISKKKQSTFLSSVKELKFSYLPENCNNAIVGEYFGLIAALIPSVFRFRQGQFQYIRRPILYWLKINIFRAYSLIASNIRSLFQIKNLVKKQSYLAKMIPYSQNILNSISMLDKK